MQGDTAGEEELLQTTCLAHRGYTSRKFTHIQGKLHGLSAAANVKQVVPRALRAEAPDYAAAAWFAYRGADDTGALDPFEFQVQVVKIGGISGH